MDYCDWDVIVHVTVRIVPLPAPPGAIEAFTEASPDRVAAATNNDLQDELLVTLGTPDAPGTRAQADAAAAAAGGVVSGGLTDLGVYEIRWPAAQDLTGRRATLAAQANVTAVSFSTVGLYGGASAYPVNQQYDLPKWTWPYAQVHAPAAWQAASKTSDGAGATVGIIDAAYVAQHEDLSIQHRFGTGAAFHATHVAGLACAKASAADETDHRDAKGMAGMAWGCPLVTASASDGSNKAVLVAMEEMTEVKVPRAVGVVNISLGEAVGEHEAVPAGGCADQAAADDISQASIDSQGMFQQVLEGAGGPSSGPSPLGTTVLPTFQVPCRASRCSQT